MKTRKFFKRIHTFLVRVLQPFHWLFKRLSKSIKKAYSHSKERISLKKLILLFYGFLSSLIFDYSSILITIFNGTSTIDNLTYGFLVNSSVILLIAIITLSITKKEIIYIPIIAVLFGSIGYLNAIFISVGIITVTWHGIIGFFTGIGLMSDLFFNKISRNIDKAISADKIDVVLNLKEDIWSITKLMFQFTLAFIAITGVCMSILFGPDYTQLEVKLNAIKMVTGFGLCMGIIFFWYFIPIINHLKEIREKGY